MTPWHDPVPLKRIWCLYELVCAMRSEETELRIVLSADQRRNLRAAVTKNFRAVMDMLVQIDVKEAKAQEESDQRQLSVRLLNCPVRCVL